MVKKNKRKGLKFEFKEVNGNGPDDIDGTCYTCYHHCSYGPELCMSLPDPRKSGDRNFNFMDFCSELEGDIVPIPGSLEKLYGKIIEKEKKDLK